ncbi:hypothetical protein NQ317_014272 [Molorchus minor]|uniref:Rrn7/TAF1B C-terminal cyclin domain-containing protein n=1 Tax=Molorchus minor TaxID=1323400 RepID=A0ABQ9J187_9CUCU|nr:hypothetical protein NQ317_014272 [Molorchus minor]
MSYMSPIKLYSLLYLGLLINNDEMQLGDLFRFMREGHLPLTNCAQLLPEGYLDKFLGLTNDCNVLKMFSHKEFRDYTARLAKFLNVVRFIGVIDITRLCQRFCKEMNLPGDVFLAAQNIISKTIPGPTFTKKDSHIPNYEGRAMSIIIFVLKLLYGLDGITEFEFSKYAQAVNKLDVQEEQMFDIVKWMEYVGYRSHIIEQHHFPTYHLKNPNSMNSELFVQYAQSMCVTNNSCVKLTNLMKSYKGVLENIIKLSNKPSSITFPCLFDSFLEYSKILFFHIKYGSKPREEGEDFGSFGSSLASTTVRGCPLLKFLQAQDFSPEPFGGLSVCAGHPQDTSANRSFVELQLTFAAQRERHHLRQSVSPKPGQPIPGSG